MDSIFRRKRCDEVRREGDELKRILTMWDMLALGLGTTIGAGIFVLAAEAAKEYAGPAITISFIFGSLATFLNALSFAEFGGKLPFSGAAYTYVYHGLGEICGWMVGWDLSLEYLLGAATVSRGFARYLTYGIGYFGASFPWWLEDIPVSGAIRINLIAPCLIMLMAFVLSFKLRQSSLINMVNVFISLAVMLFILVIGIGFVKAENYTPYAPFGGFGVLKGAGIIFFAFIGFDSISSAAEEMKNPRRDLPIAILGTILLSTIIYIGIALTLTGMISIDFIDLEAPLSSVFSDYGLDWARFVISVGALFSLITNVYGAMMPMPRIWYSMATDGLLWPFLGRLHPKHETPVNATITAGILAGILALLIDVDALSRLVSLGTIFAFTMVNISALALRYTSPDKSNKRAGWIISCLVVGLFATFTCAAHLEVVDYRILIVVTALTLVPIMLLFTLKKTKSMTTGFAIPLFPLTPILAIGLNVFMIWMMTEWTWIEFGIWTALGLLVYFSYGARHSNLANPLNSVREDEQNLLVGEDAWSHSVVLTEKNET